METKTVKGSGKKDTIIVQNFKKAVLGGAENIQFSTDRFATLETDTENIKMKNGYYEEGGKVFKDENAYYVYQPPGGTGANSVPPKAIKVKYWKRIPKDPNDITKTAEGHPAPLRAVVVAEAPF